MSPNSTQNYIQTLEENRSKEFVSDFDYDGTFLGYAPNPQVLTLSKLI